MGKGADNIEGRLDIRLRLAHGVVDAVDITSSRPLLTPRIFTGKSVEHLLTTLPLLYSVCGTAQANAAVTACEQALGIDSNNQCHAARAHLVWLETAKEHLWRVLLDWPNFLGMAPAATGVGEIMQLIKRYRHASYPNERPFILGSMPVQGADLALAALVDELEALLERQVFGMPPAQWLMLHQYPALMEWATRVETPAAAMLKFVQAQDWQSVGSSSMSALPLLDSSFLQQKLDQPQADHFIATPQIESGCYETSPFTRAQGHPLVVSVSTECGSGIFTRLVARLVELASIPAYLRNRESDDTETSQSQPLPEGVGIAQIEAARGRLIHRLEMQDGLIGRYQILAPTEWNFHPEGVLAKGLNQLQADSVELLKQQASLLINAIDPCVGYALQIEQV